MNSQTRPSTLANVGEFRVDLVPVQLSGSRHPIFRLLVGLSSGEVIQEVRAAEAAIQLVVQVMLVSVVFVRLHIIGKPNVLNGCAVQIRHSRDVPSALGVKECKPNHFIIQHFSGLRISTHNQVQRPQHIVLNNTLRESIQGKAS